MQNVIVCSYLEYVINWPLCAFIVRWCHAANAIMHLHAVNEKAYLADLGLMHKVVLEVFNVILISFKYFIPSHQHIYRPKTRQL